MIKILFAGEGGQGVQVIAEILAKAAFKEGKFASYIPNFGVEQRGGVSLAFVVTSQKPLAYPKFEKADILAILSERSINRVKQYIDEETKVILSPGVAQKKESEVTIPPKAEETFRQSRVFRLAGVEGLPPRVWNILVLGGVNRIGKIVSQESLIKAMNERFAGQFKKNPELKRLDLEALRGDAN